MTEQATSGTPAPAAAPAPVAPATFAQQVQDSQAAPAAVAAPAAAPAVQPAGEATPVSAPQGDSALQDKLAEAEKRLADTQRWGHRNATDAATLRSQLQAIQNHPVMGKLLETLANPQAPAPTQDAAADAEMRQAWTEYQSAKTEEEAFAKILKFSKTQAAKEAAAAAEMKLTERENAQRVQQRNQQTVHIINQTVTQSAPDVPLELFWALSGRAEAETPAQLVDYSERLQWQVGRAIDLARGVMQPRIQAAQQTTQQQTQINQQAAGIMSAGGATPGAQVPAAPAKPQTMAEFIRDMQRKQLESRK